MTRGSTGGGGARRLRRAALAVAVVGLLAGCTAQVPAGTPAIPTFPGPGAAPSTSAPAPRAGILPTDCNQVISADTLPNLLGLPLGSVKVSALRDVPAPTVGRLERVTCTYTSLGGPGAPSSSTTLLKILSSGYDTPQSAVAQAKVNQDQQQQSGVVGEPVPFGAAQATYFDDPEGRQLVVVYGRVTASLTLPTSDVVPNEQARAVLTDLAQRVLPVLVPAGS